MVKFECFLWRYESLNVKILKIWNYGFFKMRNDIEKILTDLDAEIDTKLWYKFLW